MIVKFFNSNQPIVLLVVPIVLILLRLAGFYSIDTIIEENLVQFGNYYIPTISFFWLNVLTSLLLTLGMAYMVSFCFNRNEFLSSESYLPALLVVLFSSVFSYQLMLTKYHFGVLFLILSFNEWVRIYRQPRVMSNLFNASFYIGIAALFLPGAVIMIPMLIISILQSRVANWREIVICIIGFILPFILLFGIHFVQFGMVELPTVDYGGSFIQIIKEASIQHWLYFVLLAVLFFIAVINLIGRNKSSNNKTKAVRVNMAYFILGLALLFIHEIYITVSDGKYMLLAIAFSFILPYFFVITKKTRVRELVFVTTVLLSVWLQLS